MFHSGSWCLMICRIYISAISTPFLRPECPLKICEIDVDCIRSYDVVDRAMDGQVLALCLLCYRIIIAIDFFFFPSLLFYFSFICPLSFVLWCYFIGWYRYYFLHQREYHIHGHISLVGRRLTLDGEKIYLIISIITSVCASYSGPADDEEIQQQQCEFQLEPGNSFGKREKYF